MRIEEGRVADALITLTVEMRKAQSEARRLEWRAGIIK